MKKPKKREPPSEAKRERALIPQVDSEMPVNDWNTITRFVYMRRKYERYLKKHDIERPGDFSQGGTDVDFVVSIMRGRMKSALKSLQSYNSLDEFLREKKRFEGHAGTFVGDMTLLADRLYYHEGWGI